jgi:hypothetical protein
MAERLRNSARLHPRIFTWSYEEESGKTIASGDLVHDLVRLARSISAVGIRSRDGHRQLKTVFLANRQQQPRKPLFCREIENTKSK